MCGFVICWSIMKIFGFRICGLAHLRNLRICNSGMSPRTCWFVFCRPLNKFPCPPLPTTWRHWFKKHILHCRFHTCTYRWVPKKLFDLFFHLLHVQWICCVKIKYCDLSLSQPVNTVLVDFAHITPAVEELVEKNWTENFSCLLSLEQSPSSNNGNLLPPSSNNGHLPSLLLRLSPLFVRLRLAYICYYGCWCDT